VAIGGTALALLLTLAEWVDPEGRDPQPRPRRGTRADIGWFLVYVAYAPVTATVVATWVAGVSRHGVFRTSIERAPVMVQFALGVAVAEACAYWLHRAMHRVPVLWRIHAVHHGAPDVRWWTTFRFHPVDGVLAHAAPLLVIAACGFGPSVIAGYLAVVFVVTILAHADVWIPGRLLTCAVALPAFHRRHHAVGHDDVNFALVLPIIDRLFGTWSVDECETDGQRRDIRDSAQRNRVERSALASAPDERGLEIHDTDLDRDECGGRAEERGEERERDEECDRV